MLMQVRAPVSALHQLIRSAPAADAVPVPAVREVAVDAVDHRIQFLSNLTRFDEDLSKRKS
jgi:hypothetical protein